MKSRSNVFVLCAVLGMLVAEQPAAEVQVPGRIPVWFRSETSNSLNQSSVALANQRYVRAIRNANKALHRALPTADQVVAHLNLCLGYLATQQSHCAEYHCSRAIRLSQGPWEVVRERGAYYLRDTGLMSTDDAKLSLFQRVVSMIVEFEPASDMAIVARVCRLEPC